MVTRRKTMKNIARFTLALFAFALFFASCDNFSAAVGELPGNTICPT